MIEAAGFVQMKGVGSSFQCAMYASMCSRSATLLGKCATPSSRPSLPSRVAGHSISGRSHETHGCVTVEKKSVFRGTFLCSGTLTLTPKRGGDVFKVACALFPHTVLSYQKAAGGPYTRRAMARSGIRMAFEMRTRCARRPRPGDAAAGHHLRTSSGTGRLIDRALTRVEMDLDLSPV